MGIAARALCVYACTHPRQERNYFYRKYIRMQLYKRNKGVLVSQEDTRVGKKK